jgi:hypothetical protein
MYPMADMVAGAVLLLLGRKLFWLFIAVAGFYFGFEVARTLLGNQPQWLVWLAALAVGAVGGIVAMLFQRVAFALGGFYAGAYVALVLAERFALGSMSIAVFLVGGIAGAVCASLIMDWAVVVLSSMVGAALVVGTLGLQELASALAYLGLLAVGVAVQARLMRGAKRVPPS